MDTYFNIPTNNSYYSSIICIHDEHISGSFVQEIINSNEEYFNEIKVGLIQNCRLKFSEINDDIVMRSFNADGGESATYYVANNHQLKLYTNLVIDRSLFSRNGLHVVQYDAANNIRMRYQILDNKGLDPIGESLEFDEAISFVLNNDKAYN